MEMAYNGRQAAVRVDSLRLTAVRGEPVEIPASHMRAALARQGWEYVHDDDNGADDNDNDNDNREDGGSE